MIDTDVKSFNRRKKIFSKEYYSYDELIDALKNNTRAKYDLKVIDKAYKLAEKAHGSQRRKSGEPYILHPISVAYVLSDLGMDTSSIAAALLHDVVEDTPVTGEDIRREFGEEIADLVEGVTKLSTFKYSSKEEAQAENVRKMFIAMGKDIRVIIIKLADRIHNMRTIEYLSETKRVEKAKENMEIYAPIADRLGMYAIKEELEDISLKCIDPKGYNEIKQAMDLKKIDGEKFIESIKSKIKEKVSEYIPEVIVTGRIKSINSIYKKMFLHGESIDQIYDIYAVRVIVNTTQECYNVLGIIHDIFTPVPNRFKDYISMPKPNMYQSLHTTVISKEKIVFEVQIRTKDMHHTAEYGIAAHWKYKLGDSVRTKIEDHLSWIRKVISEENNIEFLRDVKSNLNKSEIYVLTPKGNIITLNQGATVIDFAYAIHTEVGHRMIGAKVNKKIVPISYKLNTGEIVEIITSKSETAGPKRDWLKIVKTNEAKTKIKQWFKNERRDENIDKGKAELKEEFERSGILLHPNEYENFVLEIAKRHNCESINDFYAAIGYGGINLLQSMPLIRDKYKKLRNIQNKVPITKESNKKNRVSGIEVEGVNNCLIKLASCCNPIPGDDIIGYITRGYGVTVHKRNCINVPSDLSKSHCLDRWIEVRWTNSDPQDKFDANINIKAQNRIGMMADIALRLSLMDVQIKSIHTRNMKDDYSVTNIGIVVKGVNHLSNVISRLYEVDGVINVSRG